jgi:hypothetical protein
LGETEYGHGAPDAVVEVIEYVGLVERILGLLELAETEAGEA